MNGFSRRRLLSSATTFSLASLLAPVSAQNQDEIVLPASLGPAIPPELFAQSGNWPVAQGNLSATRSAVGSSIDSSTVDQLTMQWEFPVEVNTGYGGMTANPIVIDDLVYLQDMLGNVFALDRRSGEVRWRKDFNIPTVGPNGVTIAYGMLFATLGDTAEVFALDARTGDERWRVKLSNNPGEGIDMAPAVYDSTVYVGTVPGMTTSFNRGGTKGILYALEASSGATLWQFDTTTNNLWGNPRVNSGGGVWYPPSFDDTGGMYFGVGNAAPWPGTPTYPNGSSRPGPNDYASSMVALDRGSGGLRWHYNASEHDLFDHDFQNSPVLIEIDSDNGKRQVAVGSGKTGSVVAVDRATGSVVWETKVGRHEGDDQELLPDQETALFPGAWGGIVTPIAAGRGMLFASVINLATRYSSVGYDRMSMFSFENATGEFIALDQSTGTAVWSVTVASAPLGGATLVNDLIVFSTLDGIFRILNADSGEELKRFELPAGVNASPAIAGDMIVIPAAARRVPSTDTGGQDTSSRYAVISLGIFDNV